MTSDGSEVVALVTGAAGSIGGAVVSALAARGTVVVTADRRPLPAETAARVSAEHVVDLLDEGAMDEAFADLVSAERLHHVIAVAGGGDLEELACPDVVAESMATFTRVVANNLHVAFATIRRAVPVMRATSGSRSITLIGSINAYGGYGAPGYSAAKAGLIGLTHALAPALGRDGIRINCLTLGTVNTENLRALSAARGSPLDLARAGRSTALGRVLEPEDVASAAVSMALDLTGLCGSNVVLDSGQLRIR